MSSIAHESNIRALRSDVIRPTGVAAAATILDRKISGSSEIRVGESSGGQDHP
jgi:hypothetical protein